MHVLAKYPYLILSLVAICLFLPNIGSVHLFDWDEINFAESAREMLVTGIYGRVQIDFQPFWEKPPLFIWMQALSMKIFGVNEFAARFVNVLAGAATFSAFYYTGKKLRDNYLAFVWILLYAVSWLPHFYFKSGIIDPWFNLFIFLGFIEFYFATNAIGGKKNAYLSGIWLGLAVLTKGPAAILIFGLSIASLFAFYPKYRQSLLSKIGFTSVSGFLVIALWFGIDILLHGWWFVREFIIYQIRLFQTKDAGHGGFFGYHFVVLLVGCFPASLFFINYFIKKHRYIEPRLASVSQWMNVIFWVVLILFSIVSTKIVHYSSMCYIPLTFIAATQLSAYLKNQLTWSKIVIYGMIFIGSLIAIAITILPLIGLKKDTLIPYIKDRFAQANLQADVTWQYGEMLWGLSYLLIIIVVGYFLIHQRKKQMMQFLIFGQLVIISITMMLFVPKIEGYSQRAAIEFFKSLQGQDVYVHVLDYKSYAQLFYSKKEPQNSVVLKDQNELLAGAIEKPTFFVCKITAAPYYKDMKTLEVIGEKNGFVFFKRVP